MKQKEFAREQAGESEVQCRCQIGSESIPLPNHICNRHVGPILMTT